MKRQMKRMKKWTALFLSLCLVGGLTACGRHDRD